jgi:copper homeostasis protein
MILEVCAYNIHSCLIAEKAGASRIELCSNPLQGGVTPGIGIIEYTLSQLSIPVFPMIRPRGGNFVYDAVELEIMRRDIEACKRLGCPGIATGILTAAGKIDTENLKRLVEWAYPMQVTCHKAFDVTTDAFATMEDVIATGCNRILTSGLARTATEGSNILAQLVAQAADRIIIMPGGGVRSTNIAQLANDTKASEFHSSALLPGNTDQVANEDEVRLLVAQLQPANGM